MDLRSNTSVCMHIQNVLEINTVIGFVVKCIHTLIGVFMYSMAWSGIGDREKIVVYGGVLTAIHYADVLVCTLCSGVVVCTTLYGTCVYRVQQYGVGIIITKIRGFYRKLSCKLLCGKELPCLFSQSYISYINILYFLIIYNIYKYILIGCVWYSMAWSMV